MLEPQKKTDQPLASLRIRIASANGNTELSTFDGRDVSGKLLWGGITGLNWESQNDNQDNAYKASRHNSKLWADEYHNFEMIWSPDKIVLKVDGQTYFDKQVFLPKNTPVTIHTSSHYDKKKMSLKRSLIVLSVLFDTWCSRRWIERISRLVDKQRILQTMAKRGG